MAKRRETDRPSMLDLPLRGDDKKGDLPIDRPNPSPEKAPETPPPSSPSKPASKAPPISPARRDPRARRRKKKLWPIVLLLLLALGAAGFAYYRLTTPKIVYAPESLSFEQQVVGGSSEPQVVTVINDGKRAMALTGVLVRGEAADEFEIVSEDCSGTTRQAGESCTVQIAFAPAANGARSAVLALEGNALGELPLAGDGAAPVLTTDRGEIDFGPQPVDGRSASRVLNLTNQGAAEMDITEVVVAGQHTADFAIEDQCSKSALPASESCRVRLEFTPRAAGERAAELRVTSDGAEQPLLVALRGAGVWSGQPLDPDPVEADFGSQRRGRKSRVLSLSFINRTSEPVTVGEVTLDASGSGIEFESQACANATLAAGEDCRIQVTYTPPAVGKARGVVSVATTAGLSTTVEVSGTGVEPVLSIQKEALQYGDLRVGFDNRQQVVLSNSGTAKLIFGDATLGGSDAGAFSKARDGCSSYSLEPGKTCTIDISFKPSKAQRARADLRIESDAAGGRRTISLEGRGTSAELSVSPGQLSFGTVRRPGSADRSVTLRNQGSARMQVERVSVTGTSAADFVVSSIGCGESGLAAGASCTINVRFVPREDGARAARLVIRHDAGNPTEVPLVGTALAAEPGFSLSTGSLDFGSRQVGTRSSVSTVTVTNPGNGRLELRGISIDGGDTDFSLVAGTCDGAPYVAPKGSCTVGVRFTPRANGSRSATLRVRHTAGSDGAVRLSGIGTGG